MSGVRGFVAGVAGLSLLNVATSTQHGEAGRVGSVFDTATSLLTRWLDPYTPLVPDLTAGQPNPFVDGGVPHQPGVLPIQPGSKGPGHPGGIPIRPIRPGPGGISSFGPPRRRLPKRPTAPLRGNTP